MTRSLSRRRFLTCAVALGGAVGIASTPHLSAQADAGSPLIAYVGTYTSPLKNVLPTQVDLPPGNGRGIHLFQVDRETGEMTPYDSDKGRLVSRQTISSLPPGYAGSSFASEILVSDDGKFVYAGNRLHDSIGIFSVGEDGTLPHVGEEWTRGDYPRSFSFDPSGAFLYSCNQRADHIAVFRVNRDTGALAFTGHYVPVGNPSMIVFFDLGTVD